MIYRNNSPRNMMQINSLYDKNIINNVLDKFEYAQNSEELITKFDKRVVSSTKISDKYFFFDFSKFCKELIPQMEETFLPSTYSLRINKGIQELKFLGEEVIINNDKFYKMFSILNSNDKSRALQINVGLLRQVCTNGAVINAEGTDKLFVKNKHLKSSLPQKLEDFDFNFKLFNNILNNQIDIIKSINNETISLDMFLKYFNYDYKTLELNKTHAKNTDKLIGQLFYSKSDSIRSKLNNNQIMYFASYRNPQSLKIKSINSINTLQEIVNTTKSNNDFEINKYNLFNCYIESFKNEDSSIIKRESNRILETFDLIKQIHNN